MSEEITLNVTPLSVDTANCGFESVSIKYGDKIVIPTVKRMPDGVKSVSYRYFNGSTEIFDTAEIVGNPERNVTYTVRAIFDTEEDYICDDMIVQLTIAVQEENEIEKPEFETGSMVYNGEEQTVELKGYNAEYMKMELTDKAKDAGTYTVRVKITDGKYKFSDGTTSVEIDWTIEKAELSIIWDKFTFEYDGSEKQPKIKEVSGLADGESVDILTEFAYMGDIGQDRKSVV